MPRPFHPKGSEAGVQGACPLPVTNRVRKRGAEPPGPPTSERSVWGDFLTLLLARELSNEVGGALVQGQQSSLLKMGGTYFW